MADISSSSSAFLQGQSTASDNLSAYTRGGLQVSDSKAAFLDGNLRSTAPAFIMGVSLVRSSASVYMRGPKEDLQSNVAAYLFGILRDSKSAYLQGVYMTQVDYVWLKTSNLSRQKKFRVLTQDYDDGTLEKAEEINKTIGGGIDHSIGAVYKTWSAIIRVRHTETETNFGDKDDLEYFYSLNNPNGTPSNDITFIDHHQVEYTVHMVGKMTKNLMGCEVEGTEAWYLYKLQLMRVQ